MRVDIRIGRKRQADDIALSVREHGYRDNRDKDRCGDVLFHRWNPILDWFMDKFGLYFAGRPNICKRGVEMDKRGDTSKAGGT